MSRTKRSGVLPMLLAGVLLAGAVGAQQPATTPPATTPPPKAKPAAAPKDKQTPQQPTPQQPVAPTPVPNKPAQPAPAQPQKPQDQAPKQPVVVVRSFVTDDGSRFLLVADPSVPQVHWALASLADPADEPPGLEGLAATTVRASLGGSWRTGSKDVTSEQQALTALDDAWQAAIRTPGNPAALAKVKACDDAAALLGDRNVFHRVLAAMPAYRPEIVEHGPICTLVVTTLPAAVPAVGQLLVERREQQALRDLAQIWWQGLQARFAAHAADPMTRVYAELLALAMPNHPAGRTFEQPTTAAPRRAQALAVWQTTQNPVRTVHVLLGDFDPVAVEAALRPVFAKTDLPPPNPLPAPPREIAGVRRSVVPGVGAATIAIGWLLPAGVDPDVLDAATRWFGDGVDSYVGQELLRKGHAKVQVRCRAPWPEAVDGRSLLLLEARDETGSPKLAEHVQQIVAQAGTRGPTNKEIQQVNNSRQREWMQLTDDPRLYAVALAENALLWPQQRPRVTLPPPVLAASVQKLLTALLSGQPVVVEGRP